MGLDNKSGMHEIKKHAATIHCSNSLSLLQRKISNALLYHAYKELMLKDEHEINIKQLCNLISYSGNNTSVIKDALKGLLSTVIEWNLVNDTTGKEDWTASSILASVSLQGPVCLFAYSPRMKQLLHSPSMFGKINLFIQSRFKSSYGLALYENCIRYRGLPHTKWFEMDLFRKLMGVPAGQYMVFRDFKRRVLDKSIEEVNTYADMVVEPEIYREGRQVVKIRFCMKERPKKARLGADANSAQLEEGVDGQSLTASVSLKTKLVNQYGMLPDQCDQLLIEFDENFIVEKMTMIESSPNYQQGRVQNLAAYLVSALKNNYQSPKSSAEKLIERRQKAADDKKQKRMEEQFRDEYIQYRDGMIDRALADLSPADKKFLFDNFYRDAEKTITTILKLQRNRYNKETVIDSPQVRALLRQFALQELSDLRDAILTFEQFSVRQTELAL